MSGGVGRQGQVLTAGRDGMGWFLRRDGMGWFSRRDGTVGAGFVDETRR